MSSTSPPPPVPEAYQSQSTYLDSPKFHQSHSFNPTCLPSSSTPASPLKVSYALCGSPDRSAPVLLWINGLGHHRLACCLFDGIFAQNGIRLLSIERPSSGLSSSLPFEFQYSHRVEIVYESILEVLSKEGIQEFSLLSHSNGIIYSLYFLLNLPRLGSSNHYSCKNWFLTSPWIPPDISGNLALNLVSNVLPNSFTSNLGSLVLGFERFVGRPLGFSYGLAREWIGWSTGYLSSSSNSTSASQSQSRRRPIAPREQIESFETLQSLKPLEERTFGGKFYPPGLLEKGMKFALEESENNFKGMGIEAVMSLRGHGVNWGWIQPPSEEEEGGEEIYEKGFRKLKEKIETERWGLELRVWCAGQDGMIPKKGREWFKSLMVDRLRLVKQEKWSSVEKAGHDEILGLEIVINEILSTVKQVQ
ncbi:hypothetical protein JCM3765_001902 [Sporobolomyces pararoseus]